MPPAAQCLNTVGQCGAHGALSNVANRKNKSFFQTQKTHSQQADKLPVFRAETPREERYDVRQNNDSNPSHDGTPSDLAAAFFEDPMTRRPAPP
jgi:hypothetical protein